MNILRPAGQQPLAENLEIPVEALGPVMYEEEEWWIPCRASALLDRIDLYAVVQDARCDWRYPDPRQTRIWFLVSVWTGLPFYTLLLQVAPYVYSAARREEILRQASQESWFPDSSLPEERACSDYTLWLSEFAACDAQRACGDACAMYPLQLTPPEQRLLAERCLHIGDHDAKRALRQVVKRSKNLF